jgi:hypothetical protein
MNKHHFIVIGGILTIAGVVSWFASASPDGLERVAMDLGFEQQAHSVWTGAIAADYQLAVTSQPFLQNGLAGWLGAGLVFAVVWLWGRWLVRQK